MDEKEIQKLYKDFVKEESKSEQLLIIMKARGQKFFENWYKIRNKNNVKRS